jgi:cytochrome b561
VAYDPIAKTFHWLTLLAVVGMIALGWTMVGMSLSPTKLQYYSWHKWLGMTVLIATLLRLIWRWLHPPPPLPAAMPGWERLAAHASHYGLYLLLIAMPLTGWMMSSAGGFPVMLYGVIPLPDLVGRDKALETTLKSAHHWESIALIALVSVHALAALKHHIRDKDDVLRRMLPFGGSR